MVQETTRAVKELGMAGVALFVGPTAKPPDMACFERLYRTCEELGAAVWIHPCRPQSYADYDAYKVPSSSAVVSRLNSFWGRGAGRLFPRHTTAGCTREVAADAASVGDMTACAKPHALECHG